jgi:hypothetical protein
MALISKDSWRSLQSLIVQKKTIPDFFLGFLTPDKARELLLLASKSENIVFPNQLRQYSEALSAKKKIATVVIKSRKKDPKRAKKKKAKKSLQQMPGGPLMREPDLAAAERYFEQRRLFGGEGTSIRAYSGGLPSLGKRK